MGRRGAAEHRPGRTFRQQPGDLDRLYTRSNQGKMVPLSAVVNTLPADLKRVVSTGLRSAGV